MYISGEIIFERQRINGCDCSFTSVRFGIKLLYSLHSGLALLHKYTLKRALDGVDQTLVFGAPLQLLGRTWPVVLSTARFWWCMPRHWRSLWPQEADPHALTSFGGDRLIAWRLRRLSLGECSRGRRYFSKCRARVGYGPAPRSTL